MSRTSVLVHTLSVLTVLGTGLSASAASLPFSGLTGVHRATNAVSAPHTSTNLPRWNSELATMRAGRGVAAPAVTRQERASFQAAVIQAPQLPDMRAGELSSRDWQIIGITALAILLLIIIF